MGIPVRRICPNYLFDSVFTRSPSNSIPSSLGFLWRYFVFAVSHARIYDALASFMDYIWASSTRNLLEVLIEHDRVWFVDIVGHIARAVVEEYG
jgi:hypothetical protein